MNPNGVTPLYYQFKNYIKDKINSGEWQPNQKLPSEAEFIEQLGVSHHIIIKSLNELLREGVIYTEQGKGRFVSQPKQVEEVNVLDSYTDTLRRRNIEVDVRVLSQTIVKPDEKTQELLKIDENTDVVVIERVSYIEGHPTVYLSSCFRADMAPKAVGEDFNNGSIYHFLQEQYNITLTSADNYFEASFADSYISAILKIKEGSVVVENASVGYMKNDLPFEYSKIVYQGSKFVFHIKSRNDSPQL